MLCHKIAHELMLFVKIISNVKASFSLSPFANLNLHVHVHHFPKILDPALHEVLVKNFVRGLSEKFVDTLSTTKQEQLLVVSCI